jgi:hypothetical protein
MQHDAHVVTTFLAGQDQRPEVRGTQRQIPNLHARSFNALLAYLVEVERYEPDEAQDFLFHVFDNINAGTRAGNVVHYDPERGYQLDLWEH